MPEIAAPAGNAECLTAALKYGADAVYLGLDRFNARMKADNFTLDNLKHWTGYAHQRGAKVYVAFNTLIKQVELFDAAENAVKALASGADAVILQDLGLFAAVKKLKPDAVIHASTQMGVHNAEGALYLKDLGASRVILSREVPLSDIAAIKNRSGLEVEVFVQGALCVSFSGNCYFSSAVSGYSGNRGMCMQLCRKKYTAVIGRGGDENGAKGGNEREADTGYLLSPSDLCLARNVNDLIAAGVDSFKIEGRMRRPEYVAEAVRVYKKAINGSVSGSDIDCLKSVYNRGDYSTGYLYPINGKDFIHTKLQGHKGLFCGGVTSVSGGVITIETRRGVHAGDAFKILRDGCEVGSAVADREQKAGKCVLSAKGKIKPGDTAHITTDMQQMKRLKHGG